MTACFLLLHVMIFTAALISLMLVTEAYVLECLKFWVNRTTYVHVGDGNIRIWKDYNMRNKQKLVTAFSSIQGHKPGVRSLNAVVEWQQLSGYLVLDLYLVFYFLYLCKSSTLGPTLCILSLHFEANCF